MHLCNYFYSGKIQAKHCMKALCKKLYFSAKFYFARTDSFQVLVMVSRIYDNAQWKTVCHTHLCTSHRVEQDISTQSQISQLMCTWLIRRVGRVRTSVLDPLGSNQQLECGSQKPWIMFHRKLLSEQRSLTVIKSFLTRKIPTFRRAFLPSPVYLPYQFKAWKVTGFNN